MNAANYSICIGSGQTMTARDLINRLDPASPVQAAHIGEVWTLCKVGMRYANQDCDVLGAALADLIKGTIDPAPHQESWAQRWANCPGHIADARRWARN